MAGRVLRQLGSDPDPLPARSAPNGLRCEWERANPRDSVTESQAVVVRPLPSRRGMYGGRTSTSPVAACMRIAGAQHGVISRAQALDACLSPDAVDRYIRSGVWTRMHRRVYALWEPGDRWLQRLMAGCLWLGAGSAVSHRAASIVLGLDGLDAAPFEFSTTGRCRPGRGVTKSGIVVHGVRSLPARDIGSVRGIPVTTATRTLIDLGAVSDPRTIELALESALRKGLTSLASLQNRLDEFPAGTLKHARALRSLLARHPSVVTESALEAMVWQLLLDEGLPKPLRQYEICGSDGRVRARVDFAYPNERLAIEADGYRFHSSPDDWHRDRRRLNAIGSLGWTVYVVTWRDATQRPRAVAREVAALLTGRGG